MATPRDAAVDRPTFRERGLSSTPVDRSGPRGGPVGAIGSKPNDGRVNGLVNGRGGRINGTGYVNGLPLRRNPFGLVTSRDLRRSAVFLAASLGVIVTLGAFLGAPIPSRSPFAIDGDFSEWTSVVQYPDGQDTSPPHADLVSYAVHPTADRWFVYGRTRAPLFSGPDASSIFVVVDQDDPGAPAYATPLLGANFLAELYGWDGQLKGAILREATGADPDNATALQNLGAISAAVGGSEFELELSGAYIDLAPTRDVRLVVAASAENATDVGAIVGRSVGALLVEQRPLATTLLGPTMLVEVRFRALGAAVTVAGFAVDLIGGGTVAMPTFPFTIPAGGERVERISVDPGTLPGGTFLTVHVDRISAATVDAAPVRATLSGDGARAYVGSLPAGKVVDGVFADWSAPAPDADDPLPPSVDILGTDTAISVDAFFYLRTEGPVFAGAFLPEQRQRPGLSAGPPLNATVLPAPRIAGEDVLRIFVDTDDQVPTGQPVAGLLADRLLELRGRLGRIIASQSYEWNATNWRWTPRATTFAVAFVGGELEASVAIAFLGTTSNPRVVFAMSDWSRQGDVTDLPLGLRGTRGESPGGEPTHGFFSDNTLAPPLANPPIVDGLCPTYPTEYAGAAFGGTADLVFAIGTRFAPRFLFLCIIVLSDTTPDFFDFAEIMFDMKHDGGSAPQVDDRLFYTFSNDTFLGWLMGDGGGWVDCTGTCDPLDAAAGSFNNGTERYEFRIRWSDVWGDLNPSANAVAGFAIIVWDDSCCAYGWGSLFISDFEPDTWGHIILPEFPVHAVAVAATFTIMFVKRRRRRPRTQPPIFK